MRIFFILFLLITFSSCSFLLVDKAPNRHSWDQIKTSDCSTSHGPVVADVLLGTLGMISVIAGNPIGWLDVLLFSSSGMYGSSHIKKCNEFAEYKSNNPSHRNSNYEDEEDEWRNEERSNKQRKRRGRKAASLSLREKLEELKQLYKDKLITKTEYKKARKNILEDGF